MANDKNAIIAAATAAYPINCHVRWEGYFMIDGEKTWQQGTCSVASHIINEYRIRAKLKNGKIFTLAYFVEPQNEGRISQLKRI